jgi:hypothetical protein
MDIGQKATWLEVWRERKTRNMFFQKLNLSEIIGITYNACQPRQKGKTHKGQQAYKTWCNRIYNRLFPGKVESVWDRLKRSGRKSRKAGK